MATLVISIIYQLCQRMDFNLFSSMKRREVSRRPRSFKRSQAWQKAAPAPGPTALLLPPVTAAAAARCAGG